MSTTIYTDIYDSFSVQEWIQWDVVVKADREIVKEMKEIDQVV